MSDWILKRKDNNQVVRFDQDMRWLDEFDWVSLAQANPVYTLTGAMDIQQGTKQAGRLITLSGDWVWHNRGTLIMLRDWSEVPELEMILTHYDNRKFDVIFRNHEKPIDVNPVIYETPEQDDSKYTATINLIEI